MAKARQEEWKEEKIYMKLNCKFCGYYLHRDMQQTPQNLWH